MPPDELLIILLAVSIGGLVKGVTGMGLPPIAIPIMAIFIGVQEAVVILAIPGVVSNLWLVIEHRQSIKAVSGLAVLMATGTLGMIVGTFLLVRLDERPLALAVAAVIAAYLALHITRPEMYLSQPVARVLRGPVGFATGLLQGSIGISSPVLATYLHSLRLRSSEFVITISLIWTIFSVIQAAVLASFGLLTAERTFAGLMALLPISITLLVGIRIGRRLPATAFQRVVVAILAATALRLAYVGLWG